ncbi:hypothetical protein TRIP_B120069 [uncultured Desulfatiglans sp.]|nr:hypothetical protein TRIP_B120069 [uncultured Desulfatiglans sp.]
MIVRRQGGLTEFIPSPQEKREGILRDHTLDLLANLDARMRRIEELHGIEPEAAEAFSELMALIRRQEIEAGRINRELMDAGYQHEDSAAALAAQAGRNQP